MVIAGMFLAIQILSAQNYERIYTVDGSEYEGYISKIVPGKQISVMTERSIKIVPESIVTRKEVVESVPVYSLPDDCRLFFVNLSDSALVEKVNIQTSLMKSYKNVFVIESGVNLKLFSMEREKVDIFWSKLLKISKKIFDFTATSGYRDVILLSSTAERFTGCIEEQHMKKGTIAFRDEQGRKMTVKNSEILATRIEPVSQEKSLFQQYPFIDVVNMEGRSFEGIIVAKQPGKSITVRLSDGEEKVINTADIKSYEKRLNGSYEAPVKDVIDETPADLYINGIAMEYPKIKLMNGESSCYELVMSPDSITANFAVNENITVVMRASARTSQVRIVPAKFDDITTVITRGKQEKKVVKSHIVYFNTADMDIKDQKADLNFESNGGESIKMDFRFFESGCYVLYINEAEIDKCMIFNVFSEQQEEPKKAKKRGWNR